MDMINAISILQEHMAKSYLTLPVYTTTSEQINGQYRCTVEVAEIRATGDASTKKKAKQESAKKALQMLHLNKDVPDTSYIVEPTTVFQENGVSNFQEMHPTHNFVGKLNELCSQSHLSYPLYQDNGAIGYQFSILCKLLTMETIGIGGRKKDAKQNSASKMLKKLKEVNVTAVAMEDSKLKRIARNVQQYTPLIDNEKVIEMFNNLSNSLQKIEENPVLHLTDGTSNGCSYRTYIMKTEDMAPEEVLQATLADMNVKYEVNVIQQQPYIIILKTPGYTFIEMGDTQKDALRRVLHKTVEILCMQPK